MRPFYGFLLVMLILLFSGPIVTVWADGPAVSKTLIQPESDLIYLGAFRLPDEESNGTSWSYGGSGMGYYPLGDATGPNDGFPGSLFSVSHPYQNFVSEFTIPAPVISSDKNLDDLPVATTLQPFADVTGGRQTGGLTGSTLEDIQYYPRQGSQITDKLYWAMYEYYMPSHDDKYHGWCELDFTNLQSQGVWRLGTFAAAATSRYLFDIPQSWADVYTPGNYLAAGRNRLVNGGSWGPALYAFGPWNDGNPPADGSAVDAVEMLFYESHLNVNGYSHSDDWADGAWLTAGDKAAVILAGTKAFRTAASGLEYYGAPNVDGCGSKGYHAEPYYGLMLLYDPALLAKVAQGQLSADAVQPYARFNIEDYLFKQGCRRTILGGMTFDRAHGLLYVMEVRVEGIYARKPIVHVFRVQDAGQSPDVTPPVTPANLHQASVTYQQVDLAWNAATDNAHLVGYIVYRDGVPVATTTATSYSDDKVNPGATYHYTIEAWDARNYRSVTTAPLAVTTPAGADERMPIISGLQVSNVSTTGAVISWRTDELATTYIDYEILYSGNATTINDTTLSTSHVVTLTGLTANKTYQYHVASTDATGHENKYPSKTFRTSTQNNSPELNGIGAKRVYEGSLLQFSVRADDKDGDALLYSATGLPAGAQFNAATRQFSWTPGFDDAGVYTITFDVNDGDQTDQETVTIYVQENPQLDVILYAVPGDERLDLSWEVTGTVPATVTWRIGYRGPAGDPASPITDMPASHRGATLESLSNGATYTVTLSAMLAGAPVASDTQIVTPTANALFWPWVSVSRQPSDALRLSWTTAAGYTRYQVWHDTSPYAGLHHAPAGVVSASPWQFDAVDALGNPAENHYYRVMGLKDDGRATISSYTGEFDFALTAGQ